MSTRKITGYLPDHAGPICVQTFAARPCPHGPRRDGWPTTAGRRSNSQPAGSPPSSAPTARRSPVAETGATPSRRVRHRGPSDRRVGGTDHRRGRCQVRRDPPDAGVATAVLHSQHRPRRPRRSVGALGPGGARLARPACGARPRPERRAVVQRTSGLLHERQRCAARSSVRDPIALAKAVPVPQVAQEQERDEEATSGDRSRTRGPGRLRTCRAVSRRRAAPAPDAGAGAARARRRPGGVGTTAGVTERLQDR